jgi:transcriptional regulator with XRE-family HTH domain
MLANVLDYAAPTLREVARDAGISYEAIRSYRKGLRTPPPAVIKRLAVVLRARGGRLTKLAAQLERHSGGR